MIGEFQMKMFDLMILEGSTYFLVFSALVTAQDLHGRLVASLRNNEVEVANTLISAIELNKNSEISFFNDSLSDFQEKYRSILENIEKLP